MIHSNSIQCHAENQAEAVYSKREQDVLRAIDSLPAHGWTDRLVMRYLGYTDPNQVRPRITSLIKRDNPVLQEIGTTKCPYTGKTVRVIARVSVQQQLRFTA